jgi:hypothetical protein
MKRPRWFELPGGLVVRQEQGQRYAERRLQASSAKPS